VIRKEGTMSRVWWLLPLVIACSKPAEEKKAAPEPAPAPAPAAPSSATVSADGKQTVELAVTDNGFEPTPVKVKAGQPVELRITRKTEKTCATDIVVKEHDINQKLPLNETVVVSFTPTKTGELKYGCAMDQMIAGVLLVE
jgi:plastocyanin domain-containing protein